MKQATMKLTTIFTAFSLLLVALVTGAVTACAQEPYFKGKTIRIIVGFSPGGGYDVYARAIARHMGKHIAGNPSVIVENMAGAASHPYKHTQTPANRSLGRLSPARLGPQAQVFAGADRREPRWMVTVLARFHAGDDRFGVGAMKEDKRKE